MTMLGNWHMKTRTETFGLIIIGNEILDGRRQDAHFHNVQPLLTRRNLRLAYTLILPDQADIITGQLRWAFACAYPFFCCGGIGSTPDDITRPCAAAAARLPLVAHPEGTALLERTFGAHATPARLRMAEFPEGATLIPNPVNAVSGFSIRNGFFMPGFPDMAQPMMQWVLDTYYAPGARQASISYAALNVREADLCDLMEAFVIAHPDVRFSSLPLAHPRDRQFEIHLGVSGPEAPTLLAARHLEQHLQAAGVDFIPLTTPAPAARD